MQRIALLGASGSGKTWLASQLARALTNTGQGIQVDEAETLDALPASPSVILLLGLDLSPPTQIQWHADQALRQSLVTAAKPFQVIYGQGQQRLLNALQALKTASADAVLADPGTPSATPPGQGEKRKPWVWACEKCSDPVCEHRLLSDLLAKR